MRDSKRLIVDQSRTSGETAHLILSYDPSPATSLSQRGRGTLARPSLPKQSIKNLEAILQSADLRQRYREDNFMLDSANSLNET